MLGERFGKNIRANVFLFKCDGSWAWFFSFCLGDRKNILEEIIKRKKKVEVLFLLL